MTSSVFAFYLSPGRHGLVKNAREEHGAAMSLPGRFPRARAAVLSTKARAGSAVPCRGLPCPWDYTGPAS